MVMAETLFPARCPAPLNKQLGTEAPSGLVRVASLLIYPPAESTSPLFGLK